MKKFLTVMVLSMVLAGSAMANNGCDFGYPYPVESVQAGYYMDGNGRIQPYNTNGRPSYNRKYEDWTYLDENGYDYTIQIEVK